MTNHACMIIFVLGVLCIINEGFGSTISTISSAVSTFSIDTNATENYTTIVDSGGKPGNGKGDKGNNDKGITSIFVTNGNHQTGSPMSTIPTNMTLNSTIAEGMGSGNQNNPQSGESGNNPNLQVSGSDNNPNAQVTLSGNAQNPQNTELIDSQNQQGTGSDNNQKPLVTGSGNLQEGVTEGLPKEGAEPGRGVTDGQQTGPQQSTRSGASGGEQQHTVSARPSLPYTQGDNAQSKQPIELNGNMATSPDSNQMDQNQTGIITNGTVNGTSNGKKISGTNPNGDEKNGSPDQTTAKEGGMSIATVMGIAFVGTIVVGVILLSIVGLINVMRKPPGTKVESLV